MQTNLPDKDTSPRGRGEGSPGDFAGEARQALTHVADRAKEQVSRGLSAETRRAATGLDGVARALRKTGESLREEGAAGGTVPSLVEQAAVQVERMSSYFEGKSAADVAGDVEQFARREPILFLGGAFALGLLGARFVKSSASGSSRSASRSGSSTSDIVSHGSHGAVSGGDQDADVRSRTPAGSAPSPGASAPSEAVTTVAGSGTTTIAETMTGEGANTNMGAGSGTTTDAGATTGVNMGSSITGAGSTTGPAPKKATGAATGSAKRGG